MKFIDQKEIDSIAELEYKISDLRHISGGDAVGCDERITPGMSETLEGQTLHICKISKDVLNIAPYQRNLNEKTIENMSKGIFYQAFGMPTVHEKLMEDGKWYYSIVDGQHRVIANPSHYIVSVVSNSIPEAKVFSIANDPNCKKAASKEDIFHAEQQIAGTDANLIANMMLEVFDIKIERHPNHGTGKHKKQKEPIVETFELGGVLMDSFNKIVKELTNEYTSNQKILGDDGKYTTVKVLSKSSVQIKAEALIILKNLVECVSSAYGFDELKKVDNSNTHVSHWIFFILRWCVKHFKSVNKIQFEELKEALSLGCWSRGTSKSTVSNKLVPNTLAQLTLVANTVGTSMDRTNTRKMKLLEYIWNDQKKRVKSR
jgi:hypothetical protein